jgi:ABC-type multidrug transport system ATPase subunit
LDGTQIDPVAFRKNVAYVMQDDALVQTATPREALAFSAALRLNVSQEEQVCTFG